MLFLAKFQLYFITFKKKRYLLNNISNQKRGHPLMCIHILNYKY